MKGKNIRRLAGIGVFHAVLYLYVVPFVLYPRFGEKGTLFAVLVALIVSFAVLGTIFLEKFFKKEIGDRNE